MAEDDDERLRSNLARLRGSLDKARAAREAERPTPTANSNRPKGDSGMSLAMRAGSEFISAILVGAGIGWGLDRLLRTNPILLIVFFFIGVVAGVWNVIRLTSPKGGGSERDSRLSRTEAADKGLRPSGPGATPDASRRGASGGANGAGDGLDDDEE
jgi:ATP synthase protein I